MAAVERVSNDQEASTRISVGEALPADQEGWSLVVYRLQSSGHRRPEGLALSVKRRQDRLGSPIAQVCSAVLSCAICGKDQSVGFECVGLCSKGAARNLEEDWY